MDLGDDLVVGERGLEDPAEELGRRDLAAVGLDDRVEGERGGTANGAI